MYFAYLLFLILYSTGQCLGGCYENHDVPRSARKIFKDNQIVPDVISVAPGKLLEVKYKSNVEVKLGNELRPKQVQEAPEVKYEADAGDYYTLLLTDPDAPSRKNPTVREFSHWLVVNIPGSKVSEGDNIREYMGSAPPEGTGLHRYVFLLYKQNGKQTFDEPHQVATDGNRGRFSTAQFAKKHNLGNPIAGNFFQAQWEKSK
ncbi:unnamed protein product [Phaedon cochleariae]|uniref:Phosphatidylethanolamine-binding protein n=1 Tax=Phaedon cochleariae TaxID=80249 RepID=A0A9P0D9Q5_PHACE|nr:unnamed protein product [Phaedon cochleariae]